MLSAWSAQVYHRPECFFRRHYVRLFLSFGLSLCLRSCPLRSTILATSASIPLFVQKFSHRHTFNTIFCLLHGFIRFQVFHCEMFHLYILLPAMGGLRYSHKIANCPAVSGDCYTRNKYLFFFRFLICKLCFYTLSLGFGRHTPHLPPATGHTTTISRNSRAVCYFSKSVTLGFATLTPTTNRFFPASSRNFQRQRGAWVLTL